MRKTSYLDKCRNMFGQLNPERKARLRAMLENPTEETWEDTHCFIVGADGWTTLWQAWCAVDANAPRSKPLDGPWPKIPDQLTIYRALRYATEVNQTA